MAQTRIQLINKRGLHARAAAKFASCAAQFCCHVETRCAGAPGWVDGKSVMALMMLAASVGTELDIRTQGEGEEAALAALCELINDRFDEGE